MHSALIIWYLKKSFYAARCCCSCAAAAAADDAPAAPVRLYNFKIATLFVCNAIILHLQCTQRQVSKQTNNGLNGLAAWDGMVRHGKMGWEGERTSRQVNKIANKVKMLKCQRNARYIFYIYSFADSESALASAVAPLLLLLLLLLQLPHRQHVLSVDKSDDGRHVLTPVA